ncbi:MAG: nitroreductase family protein [Planctomycetota bacterium]
MGNTRTLYAATRDNVYEYDARRHSLWLHLPGNHLSESRAAFEVGVCGDVIEDAGVALHYAHLASCAFWTTTHNQPCCCPKESATTHANTSWRPRSSIHLVNTYGLMGTVAGITSELVAVSSDGSLPDPSTNGSTLLEDGFASLSYGDQFTGVELTLDQLSQIAWASYGCNPHYAANGKAALTVASAVAYYLLTGRIYMVRSTDVSRYQIRLPSGSETTRDHRIELVTPEDRRSQLRAALPDLPPTAPNYFVFCASDTQRWHRLEAGFCGASALLQATSLGLQGYFNSGFTAAERSAIINALSIPANHLPLLVFSVG